MLSYPRTETDKFPDSMDLRALVQIQTADASWGAFAQDVLQRGPDPRQGRNSDEAHPPIHPTAPLPGNADPLEKKIYDVREKWSHLGTESALVGSSTLSWLCFKKRKRERVHCDDTDSR